MNKLLLLAAAAFILQATPVLAEGHGDKGHKGAKMFEKQDTNADGVISEAEFLAGAKEKFSKMDANGDGTVTKDEVKAAHKAKKEMRGERKDKAEKSE